MQTRSKIQALTAAGSFDEAAARLFCEIPRFGLGYSETGISSELAEYGGFPPPIFKLVNLKQLTLTFHAVRFLPKHIALLKNLEYLNLSHNPLLASMGSEVSSLPLKRKSSSYYFLTSYQ